MQPFDVAVFKSVKTKWPRILQEYEKETRNQAVDKTVFCPRLLKKLWDKLEPMHLINGFRTSGLLPVDKSQVQRRILLEADEDVPGAQQSTARRREPGQKAERR